MSLRIAVTLCAAAFFTGCSSGSRSYPVPPQMNPVAAEPRSVLPFIAMNNAYVRDYIVRDIDDTLQGGLWRWGFARPTLRFQLRDLSAPRLTADFGLPANAIAASPEQTVSVFVNEHLAGTMALRKAGEFHFERMVPVEWLSVTRPMDISLTLTPGYPAGPGDGRPLSFILIRAGFQK